MAIHHQPGGGGFSTAPREGVIFCWDIRGNYATKSTVAECVKRLAWVALTSF